MHVETLYNQVLVEGTSTVEEHEKKIQGDKLSLICAYLHAPDDEARSDLYGDETELEPIILENERVKIIDRDGEIIWDYEKLQLEWIGTMCYAI